MTLRQFLNPCTTNNAEIYVYNKSMNLVYTGEIFLIYYDVEDTVGRTMTNAQRESLLDSTIDSWEFTKVHGLLNIYTDYEG